jgi:hypothetical protein
MTPFVIVRGAGRTFGGGHSVLGALAVFDDSLDTTIKR